MDAGREFWRAEDHPGESLGVRRHTDRCFHAAEEETEEGFIVRGVLFPRDEVAEVRFSGVPPTCNRPPERRSP